MPTFLSVLVIVEIATTTTSLGRTICLSCGRILDVPTIFVGRTKYSEAFPIIYDASPPINSRRTF